MLCVSKSNDDVHFSHFQRFQHKNIGDSEISNKMFPFASSAELTGIELKCVQNFTIKVGPSGIPIFHVSDSRFSRFSFHGSLKQCIVSGPCSGQWREGERDNEREREREREDCLNLLAVSRHRACFFLFVFFAFSRGRCLCCTRPHPIPSPPPCCVNARYLATVT